MPVKSLLIVDIDNTLFDWVRFWRASFGALVDSLLLSSAGLNRARLLAEIRLVHQRVGTSEYAFILQDLRPLLSGYGIGPAEEQNAIQAYREARAVNRELYPGVRDTLMSIKADGARIVGFTESTGYHTADRLMKLNLDGVLEAVYSPPDYPIPVGVELVHVRTRGPSEYELKITRHEMLPRGFKKPNPALLESILDREGVKATDAVYVGDSLRRDVAMAQRASVLDVYAEYGHIGIADAAEFLLAVTHWSDDEVAAPDAAIIIPSITLRKSLSELTSYVEFRKT